MFIQIKELMLRKEQVKSIEFKISKTSSPAPYIIIKTDNGKYYIVRANSLGSGVPGSEGKFCIEWAHSHQTFIEPSVVVNNDYDYEKLVKVLKESFKDETIKVLE